MARSAVFLFLFSLLLTVYGGAQARTALESTRPKLVLEVTGVTDPTSFVLLPDGRVLISETSGRIVCYEDGVMDPQPWFEFPPQTEAFSLQRVGRLTLASDFASSNKVFLTLAYREGTRNLVGLVVLQDLGRRGTFNGFFLPPLEVPEGNDPGRVRFSPEGDLFWGLPDAPAESQAQNDESWLGKILRFTPAGGIPVDNPVPGSPIWAKGFKAPLGLAWNLQNGALYTTDQGRGNFNGTGPGRDEVSLLEPGKNYGHPLVHGGEVKPGLQSPLQHSTSARGWAPTSALFVDQGKWQGSFVFTGGKGAELLYRFVFDKADPRKTLFGEELLVKAKGVLVDLLLLPGGNLLLLSQKALLEYQL